MPISELWVLPHTYERATPAFQMHDDIRFPESLARALLERYTKVGDKVFDPFVGLGTTLFVAEELGRVPYGTETDSQRYNWVKNSITHPKNLFLGDAYDLASLDLPLIDFCLTSPPYMSRTDTFNPLFNGDPMFTGYACYLERMKEIYKNISRKMVPKGYIVIQADNLTHSDFSPLVWDVGNALSGVMTLEGEILVQWSENKENKNNFTQCLVFRT